MGRSSSKIKSLRLHLAQFASVNGQPLKTLAKVQALLEGRKIRAGDWVVFPEMWPAGFALGDRLRMEVENSFCFRWLKDFAKKKGSWMAGSMLEVKRGRFFNSAYVIAPDGSLAHHYRKIHLFKLGDEHRKFVPGSSSDVLPLAWGKLATAICYDLRFPELFRIYAKKGATVVLVPSAWPRERLDHFLTLLKARAIENQCFMVGVNKIGHHDSGIPYGGHSAVYGPWGEKLVEMGSGSAVREIELELGEIDRIRRDYPFLSSRVIR